MYLNKTHIMTYLSYIHLAIFTRETHRRRGRNKLDIYRYYIHIMIQKRVMVAMRYSMRLRNAFVSCNSPGILAAYC